MLNVDIEQFWKDDEEAHKENCFNPEASQVAMGIRMSEECIFAELGMDGNPWGTLPRERQLELNKLYNDKSEKIVGKRLLREEIPETDEIFPGTRQIGEIFGGKYIDNGNSIWLEGSCSTPSELSAVLDKVEKMDIREFILPFNWESEKNRIYEKFGKKPGQWRGVRGPVTLATSIFGVENLIYLLIDEKDLALRFSKTICDVICEYASIMDIEAGYTDGKAPGGFGFADDNCCLLNQEMYEFFAFPILKTVFEKFSPLPGDNRYQHSDSAMGHLIPILSRLNFTGCNFGPGITVEQIRKYMPKTRVDGCLAPFTFMSNDEKLIMEEVKRDCSQAKALRGVNICTAGSINNGSLLTSMRSVMYAIQNYGRY